MSELPKLYRLKSAVNHKATLAKFSKDENLSNNGPSAYKLYNIPILYSSKLTGVINPGGLIASTEQLS